MHKAVVSLSLSALYARCPYYVVLYMQSLYYVVLYMQSPCNPCTSPPPPAGADASSSSSSGADGSAGGGPYFAYKDIDNKDTFYIKHTKYGILHIKHSIPPTMWPQPLVCEVLDRVRNDIFSHTTLLSKRSKPSKSTQPSECPSYLQRQVGQELPSKDIFYIRGFLFLA